jgi:DNA-damage-inducible protein D
MPRKKKDERADDELPQAYQLIQQSLFDDIVTTSPHQEFFGSIRCLFVDGVWYLSINDVMEVLLEGISKDPRAYWRQMRSRMKQQEGYQEQPGEFKFFPLPDSLNRIQKTECIRRESLFRIVQSIPSPKVENFKRFLAALGEQHMKEVERPELLIRRWINIYLNRGRTPEWIQARLKNDVIRNQLTTIWKERGADPKDYEYLTGTLHRLTFEMSVEAHRVFKSLQSGENLRDHMTELELAFSTLSETATGTLHEMNASGFA